MADCLFCSIVAEEIPADIVLSNDDVVAFAKVWSGLGVESDGES